MGKKKEAEKQAQAAARKAEQAGDVAAEAKARRGKHAAVDLTEELPAEKASVSAGQKAVEASSDAARAAKAATPEASAGTTEADAETAGEAACSKAAAAKANTGSEVADAAEPKPAANAAMDAVASGAAKTVEVDAETPGETASSKDVTGVKSDSAAADVKEVSDAAAEGEKVSSDKADDEAAFEVAKAVEPEVKSASDAVAGTEAKVDSAAEGAKEPTASDAADSDAVAGSATKNANAAASEAAEAVEAEANDSAEAAAEGATDSEATAPAVAAKSASRSGSVLKTVVPWAVAVVAVGAAIAGFTMYNSLVIPNDAAAKANDEYITEQSVSSWIEQYRSANSLSDDSAFANALSSQNMTVAAFRQQAVDQVFLSQAINDRAAELGKTPSEEDVQAKLDETKSSMTADGGASWEDTLKSYGLTEDALKDQYRTNFAQQAVFEADVPHRDPNDDELLSYMQSYLAGTMQKHATRVVFTGDSAKANAEKLHRKLQKEAKKGKLSKDAFEKTVKKNATGIDAEKSGDLGWSGGDMGDAEKELLNTLSKNEFSGSESTSDGAYEIVLCDNEYTFPEADSLTELPKDVPDELLNEVETAAGESLWQTDCNKYLAKLVASSKITYYPVPENASYNVDLSK